MPFETAPWRVFLFQPDLNGVILPEVKNHVGGVVALNPSSPAVVPLVLPCLIYLFAHAVGLELAVSACR